jgi:hypothetical protein
VLVVETCSGYQARTKRTGMKPIPRRVHAPHPNPPPQGGRGWGLRRFSPVKDKHTLGELHAVFWLMPPRRRDSLIPATRIAHERSTHPQHVRQYPCGAALFQARRLEAGYDIRTLQELLGHASVETTMIYTHVLNNGRCPVRSPLDQLSAVIGRMAPPSITGPVQSASAPQVASAMPLALLAPKRDNK